MRDQNSTKKTRRWPPRVGKRHRHEGNGPAEHSPRTETPDQAPPQEERSAPLEQPKREAVVVSRRNRLRDAVARRRQSHAPATG